MNFQLECEREDDGRWLAEVPQLPGVNALGTYGRWAFAEFRSAHDLEADFAKLIQGLLAPATV